MSERAIISLNTTLGTVLVILALAWQFAGKGLYVSAERKTVENAVQTIIKAEQEIYQKNTRFITFAMGKTKRFPTTVAVDLNELREMTGYDFDAYLKMDGTLVVRALPTHKVLQAGHLGPDIYRHTLANQATDSEGAWIKQAAADG